MSRWLLVVIILIQAFSAWQLWEIQKQDNFSVYFMGQEAVRFHKIQNDLTKTLQNHGWSQYSIPTVATNA